VLSAAIVLNERSHDATIMRLRPDGLSAETLPVHEGANAWSVSASGRWAIAWTDARRVPNADPIEGFQEITVLDTHRGSETRLSVGYRPNGIVVRNDEARAFVLSEPGISVVELADQPRVSRDLALSPDPSARAIDVAIVPEGTHAVARVEGRPEVSIVELETGERAEVTLSGPVTDLDLVADGASVIAVVRGRPLGGEPAGEGGMGGATGAAAGAGGASEEEGGRAGSDGVAGDPGEEPALSSSSLGPQYGPSQIAVLPIAQVLRDSEAHQSVFVSELVGSIGVSEDGSMAVLYTTAAALDRVVVLPLDPESSSYFVPRVVPVRAPVEAVFVAPDAAHAIVALRRLQQGERLGAFGIVPLSQSLPVKFQTLQAPLTGVAFAPAPTTSAIVTAAGIKTAYVAHMPSLLVAPIELPSLPLTAGVVPEENVAFVVQQHPEGRLSLIDLATAAERTLTGFELAAGAR
jgi:hypothetical protein